jgi:flagellar hook-associated protein FlgK
MVEAGGQEDNFMSWKAKISRVMEQLQQAVDTKDWESVNKLLAYRQQQLEDFFQAYDKLAQPPQLLQWIEEIKQLDAAMENQIREQQQAIKQVLDQVGKGRKAVDAYRSL